MTKGIYSLRLFSSIIDTMGLSTEVQSVIETTFVGLNWKSIDITLLVTPGGGRSGNHRDGSVIFFPALPPPPLFTFLSPFYVSFFLSPLLPSLLPRPFFYHPSISPLFYLSPRLLSPLLFTPPSLSLPPLFPSPLFFPLLYPFLLLLLQTPLFFSFPLRHPLMFPCCCQRRGVIIWVIACVWCLCVSLRVWGGGEGFICWCAIVSLYWFLIR